MLPSLSELQEGAVILIDKPYTWTSHDAIKKVGNRMRVKIGHCGTLDPLATGLLICCTGKFTKRITDYQKLPKVYSGTFYLGAVTPTYDLESEPGNFHPLDAIIPELIAHAAQQLSGAIQQVPPIHSAVKKDGKRAYELARKGQDVVLEPRNVTIYQFDIVEINLPEVHFMVHCSTGTYIRSLANDFGKILGCGAYLKALRREKIGDFDVQNAYSPQQWNDYWETIKPV